MGQTKTILYIDGKKFGLNNYFNCCLFPDLVPIKNNWFPVKNKVRKVPHWDTQTTMELARDGWTKVDQAMIDKWIDSMPKKLKAVITNQGKLTAF